MYKDIAKTTFRNAVWIAGEGPYALLARCNKALTVTLWKTREEALKAKNAIDEGGCGGGCNKNHEIIELKKH